MADRLFAIDGMAFAFRSYFAIRNLRDSSGRATNAVFGFARVLLKIIREQEPSHLVMVFDAPGKTFRDDLYPEYKAHRDETPEDLIAQFPVIDELVEAFGIPILRIPGVEADDVLGTLGNLAEKDGVDSVLVSGDKDLLQLVTDCVTVYDPNRGDDGVWYDPEKVKERYGVSPINVIDILGLMGDSSDNVPGVRGIGEKTAIKLLKQYGDMDGLYANLDALKGKQKEKVTEDKDVAYLSRELVTIKQDVEFGYDLEQYRRKDLDHEKLAAIFEKLEFRTLFQEFSESVAESEELDYQLVNTKKALNALVKKLGSVDCFAIDTETTSVDPMRAELVGISVSMEEATGFYIPVAHKAGMDLISDRVPNQLPMDEVLDAIRPILEDASIGKVGHNIKYDYVVLLRHGAEINGIRMDTMVASYLTDPSRMRHNLGEVSLQYLQRKMIPISDLIGKGSKAITFDYAPIDAACDYACEDADVAWRLSEVFQESLHERQLESLHEDIELPLIGVLARIEMAGVAVDLDVFEGLRKEIGSRLEILQADIFELAGEPFKINSPKQLQVVLFETLGLTPLRKTKTGYSTDVDVLEELALEHPLPEKVLEYRTLEKLRGTYVEALPKLVNPVTHRIHTSFNQAVAATGRLSSSDPNLQNIPIRTEMGRRIREAFVPGDSSRRLVSADYSQIELRILAHLSGDAALKEAFEQDVDIHSDTAARVFGVTPEDVTPDMRRQAKAVNFGVVYGISAFGLARNIGVSNAEAGKFIDNYFNQYPGVRTWIDGTIEDAKEKGYVTTLLNRRRYVPELSGGTAMARKAAERIAINTPVQGTAADVIKIAMINLDKALLDTETQIILQVHDELVVETPAKDVEEIAETVRAAMEGALELDVPLKVDVGIGKNWSEIH